MTDERGHWKSMKLKRLEKRLALVEYGTGPRVLYSYDLTFCLSQILFKETTSFALVLGGKHANAFQ